MASSLVTQAFKSTAQLMSEDEKLEAIKHFMSTCETKTYNKFLLNVKNKYKCNCGHFVRDGHSVISICQCGYISSTHDQCPPNFTLCEIQCRDCGIKCGNYSCKTYICRNNNDECRCFTRMLSNCCIVCNNFEGISILRGALCSDHYHIYNQINMENGFCKICQIKKIIAE